MLLPQQFRPSQLLGSSFLVCFPDWAIRLFIHMRLYHTPGKSVLWPPWAPQLKAVGTCLFKDSLPELIG